jgi:carbon-monoxide dehydrogenase medium subunit
MIPEAFSYKKAVNVSEALEALSRGDAKIIAGGHSLVPAMKMRIARPGALIDITGIEELREIKEENGEIVIGAAATHHVIEINNLIKSTLPFFSEAAAKIGDVQVRNYGTIGGSLANADPGADWPALVLAAEATIEVQGKKEKKKIKATNFFTGFFETALVPDEMIISIRIPKLPAKAKTSYQKFHQPASRFAIVGCAVIRFPDDKTNIAFTGVADCVFRDKGAENEISGKPINDKTISAALDAALKNVDIISDLYASEEYRRHLAKIHLKKALLAVS